MYPDYKARYQILGAAEIAKASDNKSGVYALMDKINFSREKYRLGHTKVFFRAGALAALEEARDEIVLNLVRWMQGVIYGRVRRVVYQKKADQRELIKVIQRNFRKYMTLRNWGWFILIQKTKPLIGQVNIEEELRLLEEQANAAYGAYKEQLDTKERLLQENEEIKIETKALMSQLESEQGNMGEYTERQAKASAQKADLEVQLQDAAVKLTSMEQERQQASVDKKTLEQQNEIIKKDMEDLEIAIQKLEQEKTNRDHSIRSLNDEIANQDEVINKLNKEKKHMSENNAKATEDLQAAEDKVEHLNKIKSKLEQTLDELEDSLQREKRQRTDIEKQRRKIEGDLKVTQETVAEIERSKKEIENLIARREKDISGLATKLEDEQTLVAKMQKGIKETQARVEEMEEELEAERQARAKAERQRSDLARELEQLGERLNEAGGATSAQIELNKKRESEVQKLRKDLEEAHIQQESTLMNLKRKHQDAVAEMSEQIDQLSKMKAKIEKDRSQISHEI
jgi:myosin heavy chain 6/7